MSNIFETIKNGKKPEDDLVDLGEVKNGEIDKDKTSLAEDFFAAQKDFYRHYAGDSSVAIKPSSEAPQEVRTMGIDLRAGAMYVNPVFFEDEAYSLDKANFGVLHEFEHFLELKELLDKDGGEKIWNKHAEKLRNKKRYAIFDNCFDDIKMNRSVLKKAPVLEKTEENLYKENLFTESDFTKLPKHLQFSYAILREARLPDEECAVAPDVRAKIDELKNKRSKSGVSLIDYATSPYTPMAMRIRLQEAHFESIVDNFFEEDVKEQQKKPSSGNGEESQNPEDYFKEEYADYDEKNPKSIPVEDIKKAVEKYVAEKKGGKSMEDMSKEAYAQAAGVTTTELNEYENFWHQLEQIRNPETNEAVIEELREMFQKIINERKKKSYVSKYPTEEGEILAFPAEAVIAVKHGEREPKVWETVEPKEKPKELYGDFDVTLIGDRSGSMNGQKAQEQRKALALGMEALKDFCDELDEARRDIEYDLNVRTEIWSFGDEKQVEILKPLSKELTEKQRVHVYKKLADTSGNSTYDFLSLEKIRDNISEEDLQKIEEGKLKKIIIVFSDGVSDDVSRVQNVLKDLREKGMVVVGVGITRGGKAVETTYAPDGQVCENPANLAKVLGDLLKNELKEL